MGHTIDGALNEWTRADRVDYPGTGSPGFELYGRIEGDVLVFAIRSDATAIGAGTTFWLNTDRDPATGHQIFGPGTGGGAEYNVNFFTDDAPYLYTGAAAEVFVGGPLQYAASADGRAVEFAVPLAQIGETDRALDVLVDVNNQVFLPGDYGLYTYTVKDPGTLPPRRAPPG